ncbi:MAG TPA: hypothetical protein VG848_09040 [Acetobacteraceae bacterium]|nr:hypothetical protein [Acetobacteraceae bacterium]
MSAIAVAGVLAALSVGSSLNLSVLPTREWNASAPALLSRSRSLLSRLIGTSGDFPSGHHAPGVGHAAPTPYAAGHEPAFTPPNDGNPRQNGGLAAQRDKLAAELRTLAAQIAEQNTRFNELRARTGEAAQELAAMPEISAHIARDTGTLSTLQAELKQARQKLASLRAQERSARAAPARTSPGRTGVAPAHLATSAPPETRYDPVRSLERQWRREGAQLIAARSALSTGDSAHARQWIEAVQTELVFQPVSPGSPIPGPASSNIPARLLGQAIALLNVGATSSAMVLLDRAIAYLDATPVPTAGASSISPG